MIGTNRHGIQGVLTDRSARQIDELALRLLAETGIRFSDPQARANLAAAGFPVSDANQRALFPGALVAAYLAEVPRTFTIAGREPADDLLLGAGPPVVRPQSGCPNVLDLDTGICRPALMADVIAMARLNDALPHIQVASSLIYPDDVVPSRRDSALLVALLNHTCKHIYIQPFERESAERMLSMALALRRDREAVTARPPFSFIVGPTSPMTISPNETAIMRCAAEAGIPLMFGSTPQRGATAPITVAGQLLLLHAENLAGMVLTQVFRRGAAISYGIRPGALDMRTANATWGGPEWGLATAGALQLAQGYGFVTDISGLPTDSKTLDEQAGAEKGFTAGLMALSDLDVVAGAGFIETIMSGSFEQLVIDDELAGMLQRVQQGITVDDAHLAFDLLTRIGPGGNFLLDEHTRQFMRSEAYLPEVFNRQVRATWLAAGGADAVQAARSRARQLIAGHRTPPLTEELAAELACIVDATDA